MKSTSEASLSDEIQRLEARLEREPGSHTFARLADLLRLNGELDRGLQVVDSGLAHHPHYLNGRLVRARILDDLGRDMEARHAFRAVLEIDRENQAAREALETLDNGSRERTVTRATADVGTTRARSTGASVTWLAGVEAAWRSERPASAGPRPTEPVAAVPESAPEPEQAATRSSEASMETATMAALYLEQGLFDEAVSIYERLLARDPYSVTLAEGLDRARQRRRDREGGTDALRPRPHAGGTPASGAGVTHDFGEETTERAPETTAAAYFQDLLHARAPVAHTQDLPAPVSRLRNWLAEEPPDGGR